MFQSKDAVSEVGGKIGRIEMEDSDGFEHDVAQDKNYSEYLDMYENEMMTNKEDGMMGMMECVKFLEQFMDADAMVSGGGSSMDKLLKSYEDINKDLHTIRLNLVKEKVIEEGDINDMNSKRINKLFEMNFHCTNAIKSLIMMRESAHISTEPGINTDWGVSRFMPCKPVGELNSTQQLITSLLFCFWDRKYKRYKESCYEPIFTEDGHNTLAYKCVGKIEDIMYEMCSDQYANNEMWRNITTGNSARNTLKFITKTKDPRFQDLEKNRGYFAFNNGTYCAYNGNPEELDKADKFYKYGTPEHAENIGNICCARYFDCDFPEDEYNTPDEDWKDIRIPGLESVFNYQKIDMDVQDAMMQYFFGRMLYSVGELDDCQLVFFLLGRAGTGKSTILNKVIAEFYDPDDVGVISNNIERKFGLGSLYQNFIVIAPEVKKDFTIDQAEWQSMASGEKMQLAIKGSPSVCTNWTAPMCSAGNQVPGFDDNSGSISRRMPTLEFEHLVRESDSNLGKKLMSEVPLVMLKGNRAYLQYVKDAQKTRRTDIWKRLPRIFHENKLKIIARTNGLVHFIISKIVTGDPTSRIKLDDFVLAMNQHLKDYNYRRSAFDKEYYQGPFEMYHLQLKNDHTGKTHTKYVYGCKFASEVSDETKVTVL